METRLRCGWCEGDEQYQRYHDDEWGVPVTDKQALFERLILEGMQAGLAWITILRKRAEMQAVFHGFDIERLAACTEKDVQKWLGNAGIIRHRGKLEAMISNAQLAAADNDFSVFLWQFRPETELVHQTLKTVPSDTSESKAMSVALKKLGYRFVGPTICYAFMQSVGMVNDHVSDCWRHDASAALLRGI